MKVILTQDIKGTGKAGDLVNVSDGYAKNFLLKKGLALIADSAAMNEKIARDKAAEHHAQVQLDEAKAAKAKLDGKTITITAKAGASGKLFGSITTKEISDELKKQFGEDINKKKITLNSDIKSYGSYTFEVKLHTGVSAKLNLNITE